MSRHASPALCLSVPGSSETMLAKAAGAPGRRGRDRPRGRGGARREGRSARAGGASCSSAGARASGRWRCGVNALDSGGSTATCGARRARGAGDRLAGACPRSSRPRTCAGWPRCSTRWARRRRRPPPGAGGDRRAGSPRAGEIAAAVARGSMPLILGYADLAASLGRPPGPTRPELLAARPGVAARGRARCRASRRSTAPILGNPRRGRPAALRAEHVRALGFDGKWAVHPGQLPVHQRGVHPRGRGARARRARSWPRSSDGRRGARSSWTAR